MDETVAAIRAADPDIIGIEETRLEGTPCTADVCPPKGPSVARKLAAALGYHYYDQRLGEATWANAILSRYPISDPTPNDLGVKIEVPGRDVYAYSVHLDDSPYQPYQLLGIKYGDAPFIHTERQAIRFARRTRGPAIDLINRDLEQAQGADAAFIFGDFNEPSAHDWTSAAVAAGQQPLAVALRSPGIGGDRSILSRESIVPRSWVSGRRPGPRWPPRSPA